MLFKTAFRDQDFVLTVVIFSSFFTYGSMQAGCSSVSIIRYTFTALLYHIKDMSVVTILFQYR